MRGKPQQLESLELVGDLHCVGPRLARPEIWREGVGWFYLPEILRPRPRYLPKMTLSQKKLETRPYRFKPWFHVFFGESVTFWECMVGMRTSTPSMQWPGGFSSYFEANRMPEQNLSFFTIPSWEELNCIPVHSSDSFSVFFGPSVRGKYLAESLGYGMHWIHGIPFFYIVSLKPSKKRASTILNWSFFCMPSSAPCVFFNAPTHHYLIKKALLDHPHKRRYFSATLFIWKIQVGTTCLDLC